MTEITLHVPVVDVNTFRAGSVWRIVRRRVDPTADDGILDVTLELEPHNCEHICTVCGLVGGDDQ